MSPLSPRGPNGTDKLSQASWWHCPQSASSNVNTSKGHGKSRVHGPVVTVCPPAGSSPSCTWRTKPCEMQALINGTGCTRADV
eukprot:12880337-Prorocentrum_lima.AAC.1